MSAAVAARRMSPAAAATGAYAPSRSIPPDTIINVEHPGIVKNIDRAVASLGGEERLGQYLHDGAQERSERNLKFNLRPEDPFRIGIDASTIPVSNLVVRISVPKYTGRKRKRGSADPFVHHGDPASSLQPMLRTHDLLRTMRDNADAYEACVVGQCGETHRFRKLPDFQYSTMQSPMADRLKKHMLPFDYENIVDFRLDPVSGGCRPDEDLVPPPKFSQLDVPYNYLYLDNPSIRQVDGEGGKLERQLRWEKSRSRMHVLAANVPDVPTEPLPECLPEENLTPHHKKILAELRELLDERPIITRRVALNLLSHDYAYDLRYTVQYCSYMFKSGPFKDAYCKFGVDPRKDPEMRKYQTLVFQLKKRGRLDAFGKDSKWAFSAKGQAAVPRGQRNAHTHLFDGLTPPASDGKTYQVCDITDPMLVRFLAHAPVQSEFEPRVEGWYYNGTWATLRVIVKDKIELLQAGVVPDGGDYARLLELPSELVDSSYQSVLTLTDRGTKYSSLVSQIRAAGMSNKYRGTQESRRATLERTISGGGGDDNAAGSPDVYASAADDDETGDIEDDMLRSEDEPDEAMGDDD